MSFIDKSGSLYRFYSNFRMLIENYWSNLIWMNFYQGINISTSLIVSVAFARLASQDLYGQYIFVISIMSFVSLVSIPGVRTTIFRSVSNGKEDFYPDATKLSFMWSLIGIPLLLVAGLYFYSTKSQAVGLSIMIGSMFFPLMYSLQNWKNLLKAKESFNKFVIYETSISFTKAILIIGFLLIDPENLIVIMFIYFFVSGFLNLYFYLKSLKLVSYSGKTIEWKRESYEYTLLELTSRAFNKIDKILIGILLPFNQVAIYNIAMKVVDTIFKFTKSSIEAMLPGFFKGEFKVSKFLPVFLLLFLVPIGLYPIIEYLILFLYTGTYSDSILLTQIYLLAVPFYFLAYVSGEALIKHKESRAVLKARLLSLIIFLPLTIFLVLELGILGAVISSVAYYPIQSLMSLYYLRDRLQFSNKLQRLINR